MLIYIAIFLFVFSHMQNPEYCILKKQMGALDEGWS